MSAPLAGQTGGSFFADLVNRVKSAISRWREISRLDREEIDVVARDLNLSPGELVTLMYTSAGSLEQLDKRLAYAGLSANSLAACHSEELRDLRRVCSQCSSKGRCAKDLRHKRMATPSKYCPNEPTLRLLVRDARNERSAQVLNTPTKLS
jgi:hypothetical protein